jgi:hypothetical protein
VRLAPASAVLLLAGCGGGPAAENGSRNMSRNEVAAEQAQLRITPGQWELATVITAVDAPDLPREMLRAMLGRRTAVQHCITPQQANDPGAFTRSVQQQNSGCQVRGFTMRGGRLSGETLCAAGTPQEVRAQMSGTYGPDSFDYETRTATPAPIAGGTMIVTVWVQGRRTGECAPGSGESQG